MDVRKLARSVTINTGTDSTARKGSGSRDKCLYSYLKPWGVFTSWGRCESIQLLFLRNLLYTTDIQGGAEPNDTF